ncbi:DMT family transporter [Nocardioides mangrovi]|uniref:DMT family transporter n=1 Tax=Nocardioides mangrovi TaxID=2874580 RepID=A0ABS7UB34_9ACTN|nr:DMT family transporter [Nocardioides mangrovi]MBZ5737862.1 DMT family transporter [Nocardioides mangrovi]
MPTTSARASLGLLQISLAGVLWGTGGLAVHVIREAEPLSVVTISAWRMLIGAVALLAMVALARQLGDLRELVRRRPGRVVVIGVATATYQALYFAAVVWVGVTVSTVVSLGLAPLIVTLVESVRRRRAPGSTDVLILAAALVGLVLVSVSAGSAGGPHPVLGVLASIGSGTAYALTTVVGHGLAQSTGPLCLATASTSVGALALAPLAVGAGVGGGALTDPVVAGTLVYLGVLTMGIAYLLFYAGLRTAPGSSAVIATLLEPLTAAVLAALLLDERLGAAGVLGGVLILAAVAGLGRRPATALDVSPAP